HSVGEIHDCTHLPEEKLDGLYPPKHARSNTYSGGEIVGPGVYKIPTARGLEPTETAKGTATGLCCTAMRSRRRLCAWALVACIGATATSVGAPRAAWADETSPANVAAARRHFERAKAYYYVHRLEGAKKELEDKQAAAAAGTVRVPPPPPPPPKERTAMGRIDALDIGTASGSPAGLVFGIVMGAKAEQDRPPSPFITGRNGTYADLVDRQANAH